MTLLDRDKGVWAASVIVRWQQNGLYFCASQTAPDRWLVWCSFSKLVAENPVHEAPEQTVWFEFDESKEVAIAKLLQEVYPGDG